MLAHDDADVISKLPQLDDLPYLRPGVLSEVVSEIIQRASVDEPEAKFQNYMGVSQSGISP